MAAEKMLLNKDSWKENKQESFSVKPFYDMVHSNSYSNPTQHSTMDVSSSSPKDRVKGNKPPSNASSSRPDIKYVHGDGRSFEMKISKCYANYLFALRLPHRVGILLPSSDIMATFICNGVRHKVKFFGKRKTKMFGSGWRQFVEAHNMAEGDRLKFKIIENSEKKLKFSVDILKHRNSSRSNEERRGTIENPIDIYGLDDDDDNENDNNSDGDDNNDDDSNDDDSSSDEW